MEETLTDCLVRVREDLSDLERVRDYLNTNKETETSCSVTWRTIEAFNSILGVCSSQHTPETNALDTLLDSFYYLARNNTEPSVWNDFGFELGIICVKVLSAIERSEIFEVLFCKLLTVINVICEHNTNVWKAPARQILNVFINKKFSLPYFETVLKLYICILRNVDNSALHNFSSQNLHLLKTLSMLVQRVGDFEIQSDIMELVFLHLPNNTALMKDFFATSEKKLFESLQFTDFEEDCRTYLNALNKSVGGFEKKVYSIRCHVLNLGGCFVEPPVGANSLWVDANRETKRLSIRCAESGSEGNRVIYILFSDILHVQLAKEKSEGSRCLTIQTKSLSGLQFDVKNDDLYLMVENGEALFEIVNFLNVQIKRKNKVGRKVSKTTESLFIDRNRIEEIQDNAVTSSEKRGIDHILPDILNLFENANPATSKTPQSSKTLTRKITTPPRSQEHKVIAESQELSPNSFVESLNKHIGRDSPEIPHTFEDSVETIEFLQRGNPAGSHKLFRSPYEVFQVVKTEEPNNHFSFIFDEDKENKPVVETINPKLRTYERKQKTSKPSNNTPTTRLLRDRKNLEAKLANTQSQDYFQQSSNVLKKKKPSLPKLKRSSKTKAQKPEYGESKAEENNEKKRLNCTAEVRGSLSNNERKPKNKLEKDKREIQEKVEKPGCQEKQHSAGETLRKLRDSGKAFEEKSRQKPITSSESEGQEKKSEKRRNLKQEAKPSLLDPNGYAYRRWCEPTTSERSNFWLKKLNAIQKPKVDTDNVFDFSENSESDSAKCKRKKRRVVLSKRNSKTKETQQTSLKQVKEILRKASPKGNQALGHQRNSTNSNVTSPKTSPRLKVCSESPKAFPDCCCDAEPQQTNHIRSPRQDSAVESDGESVLSVDGKALPNQLQKPDCSDEDTPPVEPSSKKKPKAVLLSGNLLSALRRRLLEKEKKDKQQTDEIIATVNKAANHLFNHLQRKDGETVKSYLSTAEEAVATIESEVEGLSLRAVRTERAMMYFQAGCSVAGMCESLEGQFSGVRSALRDLAERKDVSKTITRINERLLGLIKSGIDRSIESELAMRRDRLLKCASIFDAE